jgi:hypothetical protein
MRFPGKKQQKIFAQAKAQDNLLHVSTLLRPLRREEVFGYWVSLSQVLALVLVAKR